MSRMAAPLLGARLRGPVVLIVMLCAFVSTSTTAQTVPVSIPPSRRDPAWISQRVVAALLQQQPVFEAVVSRVRVDVIVTDDDGRFVEDLRLEDFLVYEDGELQQVLTAQLVDSGARTVIDLPTASAADSPPEEIRAGGAEAPDARPSAGDLGAMVFLIDGYSLDPVARARFASGWNEILDATESFDVPRAAYLVDAAGSLRELAPLTYEVDTLRQVADEVRAIPAFGISLESRLLELLADMQTASRNESRIPGGASPTAEAKAQAFEHDELLRSIATLEILTTFCNALSARSGRTALVWVSTGVKLTEGGPYGALVSADSFDALANLAPDRRILERETALHEAANSANVSIYAIDPTTPGARRNIGLSAATPGGSMEALQSDEVRWAISALSDSLHNAADATGGQAYVMPSDLALVLRAVKNDGRQYYMLTYAAPAPYGDSEYHEIRVEVLRPDVRVRARGGYVDLPEEERKDRMILAALTLPGMVTRMPVEAEAIRRWSQDGEPILQMLVAVDAGRSRAEAPRMEVHAFAVNGSGDIVAEVHEELRFREAPDAEVDGSAAEPFIYVHDWTLEPGEYELRIAVRDSGSGRLGATQVEIEVPEPTPGWHSSDLMLMVMTGDGEPQPVVGGRFRDGDTVSVYAEVADGIAPFISGMILDTAVPDSRPALLPAYHLQRDVAGIHRGSIGFRGLPAGIYSLEISVTDAHADRQQQYSYPLEVLPRPDAPGVAAESEVSPPEPLDLTDLGDPTLLPSLLERLTRVAWLYMDQALSFVADESIESISYDIRRSPTRRTRRYQFEYVYGLIDEDAADRFPGALPGKYTDYRRRKGARGGDRLPEEVVSSLRLPTLISKAYSFPLIFREALWPMHDFEVRGEEMILGRQALGVRIIPKPPIQEHMNDWFGTAWFDRESLQPLKFEVFKEDEFIEFSAFEAAMRGEIPADDFTFTRVTALFDTEKNGMRFPSRIVIDRSRHQVKGPPDDREASDHMEFRVTQRYSNYRFFNVRTEEEVRELVFGQTRREGGR